MRNINSINYYIRYKLKKTAVDLHTWLFDREIKQAYNTAPGLSPALIRETLSDHPVISVAAPLTLALLLTVILLPDGFLTSTGVKLRSIPSKAAAAREAKPAMEEPEAPSDPKQLHILLADKTAKKLSLLKLFPDGTFKPVRDYPIAIGEKWGRKVYAGDLKTPEGFYWIMNKLEDFELPPIYGVRAFILSYPNKQDQMEKRSGTGIWIHGCEPGKKPDKTKGCLELDNPDLEDISRYIGIGTPVLISEALPAPGDSIAKYFGWEPLLEERRKTIALSQRTDQFARTFVERWRAAWESRDLETYAGLYDVTFSQNDMAYPEWKEYKRAIFERPQDILLNITDVKLTRLSGDTATITFTQEYLSGPKRTLNGKMLRIVKSQEDWRIVEETVLSVL